MLIKIAISESVAFAKNGRSQHERLTAPGAAGKSPVLDYAKPAAPQLGLFACKNFLTKAGKPVILSM